MKRKVANIWDLYTGGSFGWILSRFRQFIQRPCNSLGTISMVEIKIQDDGMR